MAKQKPGGFEYAKDSRRVQPLAGHTRMRLFDHKGKGHNIEATPEAVEAVLGDAPDDYRTRVVRDLKDAGFLIPLNEVHDG